MRRSSHRGDTAFEELKIAIGRGSVLVHPDRGVVAWSQQHPEIPIFKAEVYLPVNGTGLKLSPCPWMVTVAMISEPGWTSRVVARKEQPDAGLCDKTRQSTPERCAT